MFSICLPPLEYKLREDTDFCVFCSFICLKNLEEYVAINHYWLKELIHFNHS